MSADADKKPATHRFQPLPTGKVFDVVRPGKTPALPTSRPVISGNKPPAADDQFVANQAARPADDPSGKHTPTDGKERAPSNPISDSQDASSEQSDKTDLEQMQTQDQAGAIPSGSPVQYQDETSAQEEPTEETPPAEPRPADVPGQEEPKDHSPTEPAPEKDDTPPEAQDKPASSFKSVADDASAYPHDELLANTDFQHEMVVSHHHSGWRWWQYVSALLLIVVLALVAFNFLLDAEIVKTQLDIPHTDLLK